MTSTGFGSTLHSILQEKYYRDGIKSEEAAKKSYSKFTSLGLRNLLNDDVDSLPIYYDNGRPILPEDINFLIEELKLDPKEAKLLWEAYKKHNTPLIDAFSRSLAGWSTKIETSEKFEGQLEVIQDAVEQITLRLEKLSKQNNNATNINQELQNLKSEILETIKPQLSQLQQTGQELQAQVIVPSREKLKIKLVDVHSLDRLEEYRSDQGVWSAFSGIFIGAILGILINWATGGIMTAAAWVLIVVFVVLSGVYVYFNHVSNRRIERVKRQMLDEDDKIMDIEEDGFFHLVKGLINKWNGQ